MLAALAYIVLTAITCAPLIARISSTVPNDAGDPVLNAWILWWDAASLPLTTTWWNGLGFYPLDSTIAFSEHLLGLTWLTSPLIWLGATPAAAHNVAFLLSFPLSALAAYALAWQVTRRHDAAFLAGLCFGFHPYRAAHLAHLQVLTSFWMPFALVGLHRFFDSGRRRWLALFAVSWVLQSLSNNYYLLYFSVLVGAWLLWFGVQRGRTRQLLEAAAAWAIAMACVAPVAVGYLRAHAGHGLERSYWEVAEYGADLASFVNPSSRLLVWGWAQFDARGERELFLGVTAVIVIAAALLMRARSRAEASLSQATPRRSRIVRIVGGLGLAVALVAIWAWLSAAGLPIPSPGIRNPEKLFTIGLLLIVLALGFSQPVLDMFRRRSALAFYALAAVGVLILSAGPEARMFGTKILYRTPYAYLMDWAPGFDGVRVPSRFVMVATLCMATALALAYARLVPSGSRRRLAWASVVAAGLLADGAIRTLQVAPMPAAAPSLAGIGAGVVMELPIGTLFDDVAALYRSSTHRRRLVNGYSGYGSRYYTAVQQALEAEDVAVFDQLATSTPLVVLVDRARDKDGRWARFVERVPYMERLGASAGFERYRLPLLPRHAQPPTCCALPIPGVVATANGDAASRVVDGDIDTAWFTPDRQKPGQALVADLGATRAIASIELDQGTRPDFLPGALEIAVSDDGQQWTGVWAGGTAIAIMRAVTHDPSRPVLRFDLGAGTRARYVRITQTAATGDLPPWMVSELRVIGRE